MSKTKQNLSKSSPKAPQKPAVKETPKAVDFLHKTVSAFFPDDRAKLFEALKGVIVKAIPANNRDGAIESENGRGINDGAD
ncbi:MAG: hypothetical protein ABSC60_16585 [Acidobacteriota bacterium]